MDDHAETIVVAILKRRENLPAEVVSVAERAEVRLHRKFRRMENQNKRSTITAVAVARELAGFF